MSDTRIATPRERLAEVLGDHLPHLPFAELEDIADELLGVLSSDSVLLSAGYEKAGP